MCYCTCWVTPSRIKGPDKVLLQNFYDLRAWTTTGDSGLQCRMKRASIWHHLCTVTLGLHSSGSISRPSFLFRRSYPDLLIWHSTASILEMMLIIQATLNLRTMTTTMTMMDYDRLAHIELQQLHVLSTRTSMRTTCIIAATIAARYSRHVPT